MTKIFQIVLYLILMTGLASCGAKPSKDDGKQSAIEQTVSDADKYTTSQAQPIIEETNYKTLPKQTIKITTITEGLNAPWGMAWLPDGDILLTEKGGALRRISDGALEPTPISGVPDLLAAGQGGLLDVTIHPKFSENKYVYLSYSHGTQEANRLRVARGVLDADTLQEVKVIFEVAQSKTGDQHFGSRFLWLPDGTLLFSVGDGGNPPLEYNGRFIREQAQSLAAHLGKVHRINDDGSIPKDNPFVDGPDAKHEIWSYGHRNIQGLTYDTLRKRVIASEHGSQGGDELNAPASGQNYGWPIATYSTEYGRERRPITPHQILAGTQQPLAVWSPSIAPSGLVFYTGDKYPDWSGDLFLAGMRTKGILQIEMDDAGAVLQKTHIPVGDVRVRHIAQGPDGYLYFITDTKREQNATGAKAGALIRIDGVAD